MNFILHQSNSFNSFKILSYFILLILFNLEIEMNYEIWCLVEISLDNVILSLSFCQILKLIFLLNMNIKTVKIFRKLILLLDFIVYETCSM